LLISIYVNNTNYVLFFSSRHPKLFPYSIKYMKLVPLIWSPNNSGHYRPNAMDDPNSEVPCYD